MVYIYLSCVWNVLGCSSSFPWSCLHPSSVSFVISKCHALCMTTALHKGSSGFLSIVVLPDQKYLLTSPWYSTKTAESTLTLLRCAQSVTHLKGVTISHNLAHGTFWLPLHGKSMTICFSLCYTGRTLVDHNSALLRLMSNASSGRALGQHAASAH